MSQTNEELVRTLAKAFEEAGTAGVRAYFDPEIEWHEDPAFPEAGVYSGIEAVEAYMEQFFAEFAEIHYEVADTKAVADSVLAHMRINGVGRASGAEFTLEAWWRSRSGTTRSFEALLTSTATEPSMQSGCSDGWMHPRRPRPGL